MAEETEVLTAPQETGVVAESTSKETLPSATADVEPQVSAVVKVEDDKSKPQVQAVQRARPSEFYGMRKDMKFLRESISRRDQQIEEMAAFIKSQKSPESVVPSKFDKDKFFTDPETVLSAREKAYQDKLDALDARIKAYEEGNTVSERQRNEQEALEKLFPKSDGLPDSLEERMDAQDERVQKLLKLLKDKPVLDMAFKLDPKCSIELILEKLDAEPAKNPMILPKKLMGGAKGGSGAASNLTPKEQKRAELKRLMNEMDLN